MTLYETPVATGQIASCGHEHCQNMFPPAVHGRAVKRFCSDPHRTQTYALAHPRWPNRPEPIRDPGKLIHLKPSALAVLGRLLQGPATTHDLLNIEYLDRHGNMRRGMVDYRSRISECRRVGYNIVSARLTESSSVYTLIPKES